MSRSTSFRVAFLALSALVSLFLGSSAQAATRSMVGSIGMINPSVAPPFFFEVGPSVLGRRAGPYAPTKGWQTIAVAGTTPGTFVGRTLTLGAGQLDFSGLKIRDFPAFPNVANLTLSFRSTHQAASFMVGGGALAACPGDGCTSTGAGTAISWCPPLAEPMATPAPGTTAMQVGHWDCPSWQAGAAGGHRFLRIGLTNAPGANRFGGTFALLRNHVQNVWRVVVQPGTDGIAEVIRNPEVLVGVQWTPGRPNFQYHADAGNPGPRLNAYLNENGAVTATLGCVNPTGTPGGTFMLGDPITGVGSNCGTATTLPPPLQGWGFRMTTGDLEGSDPFPFGVVISSMAPPGTPFAPNVGTQPTSLGFFFTRMGGDSVSGSDRNLVLLGGGVAVDPPSGNAFFRILDLRLQLSVPEPASGLALLAGAATLAALGRRRIP